MIKIELNRGDVERIVEKRKKSPEFAHLSEEEIFEKTVQELNKLILENTRDRKI